MKLAKVGDTIYDNCLEQDIVLNKPLYDRFQTMGMEVVESRWSKSKTPKSKTPKSKTPKSKTI